MKTINNLPTPTQEKIEELEKKKVPVLINNLHTMCDLNSERAKKRSEQMKKRKEKFEGNNEESETPHEGQISSNSTTNFNKGKPTSTKKFIEEENLSKNHQMELNHIIEDRDETNISNSIINAADTPEKEETEIVVSDLECEIEDLKDPNINATNTNNKSFIPINNHLRSKRAVSVDKATPSYLMALYQYEESDNSNSSADNANLNNITNQTDNYNNLQQHDNKAQYQHLRHNYIVDDVIEEETSENNTDSEYSSRKKSSFLFSRKKGSSSDRDSNYFSSPTNILKKYLSPNNPVPLSLQLLPIKNNYKTFNDVRHSKSETLNFNRYEHNEPQLNVFNQYGSYNSNDSNKSSKSIRKKKHKASKSELNSIHTDMKKMIENLEKKLIASQEERQEKIKLRKKNLLHKFSKANSLHNLPYKINFSSTNVEKNAVKQLSICTTNNNTLDKMFKKLSPSGTSGAYYYDYISERLDTNDDQGKKLHEYAYEDELNEKNSIIEIKDDEDVNFENELNYQLEKNEIKSELGIDEDTLQEKFKIAEIEEAANLTGKIEQEKASLNKKFVQGFENMKIIQLENFNYTQSYDSTHKYLPKLLKTETGVINDKDNYLHPTNFNNNVGSFSLSISNNLLESLTVNHSRKKSSLEIVKTVDVNFSGNFNPKRIKNENLNNKDANSNTIFNSNFINNNINNISISIVSPSSDTKILKNKISNRSKNNSITHDIRKKYQGHYKSPSINITNKAPTLNEEKIRSNSFSKNQMANTNSLININSATTSGIDTSKMRKSIRQSGINTPKKSKIGITKDLKHFLVYSDNKINLNKEETAKSHLNKKRASINSNLQGYNTNHSNSSTTNLNEISNINNRVNSETSVNNVLYSSNKQIIFDSMAILKFQISSLDHQKFSFEKLNKSKAKFFCVLIGIDPNKIYVSI